MLNRGSSRWMAALAAGAALALAALPTAASPAAAEDATPSDSASVEPSPTSTIPNLGPQTAGSPVCTVQNKNLDHLTGMVLVNGTIYAVEGGVKPNQVEIWSVNPASCDATVHSYGFTPQDPQDIAVGTDGALWVLDDTNSDVTWLTFERVDPAASGAKAVPYRATKPAGVGELNAKGMIMGPDNLPVVIAASGAKIALYKPSGPMTADTKDNLPTLTKVGEITPQQTGTPSVSGLIDQLFVSGASISADRTKVVVRTKSDAYEFPVGADGDIVAALTGTTAPVITPLPMEEDGEAITYNADGTAFLTMSSMKNPVLRTYTPYVPPPPPPPLPPASSGGGLDFGDIQTIATVTGVVGLLAVIAGVVGIARFRRGLRSGSGSGSGDDVFDYEDDARAPRPRRRSPEDGPRRSPVRVGPGEEHGRDDYGRDGYGGGARPPHGGPGGPGGAGPGYGPAGYDQGYGDPGPQYPPPPQPYGPPAPAGAGYGGGQYGGQQPPPPPYGGGGGAQGGSGNVYGGGQYGGPGGPGPGGPGPGPYGEPTPPPQQPRRGGTYGRPQRPDEEPPRRGGYGRDNIDM